MFFQAVQAPPHDGRCHALGLGSRRQAALLGHRHKGLESFEFVHAGIIHGEKSKGSKLTPMPNTHHPTLIKRAVARLAFMLPVWFAMVMGWSGLAQAWIRSTPLLGDNALGVGLVAAGFALLVFMLLCAASLVRWWAHPLAVLADMRHPVRHAFMAALPISMLLLATLGMGLFWHTNPWLDSLIAITWWLGSVLELAATVWVLGRWLKPQADGGLQWSALTPVMFIPIVGNVLAPLAGVPLGAGAWATAQMAIGMFLWPIVLTLLFVRMAQAGPLPPKMVPTLFVTLAPPSVLGLSFLQLSAPEPVAWGLWGVALFFFVLSCSQLGVLRELPFGMTHWGMSFPLAAFSALSVRMSQLEGGAWLQMPATVLLALTSLVILGLTLGTWRGLRLGHLLVAEH
jgi:tellurite resistance protein